MSLSRNITRVWLPSSASVLDMYARITWRKRSRDNVKNVVGDVWKTTWWVTYGGEREKEREREREKERETWSSLERERIPAVSSVLDPVRPWNGKNEHPLSTSVLFILLVFGVVVREGNIDCLRVVLVGLLRFLSRWSFFGGPVIMLCLFSVWVCSFVCLSSCLYWLVLSSKAVCSRWRWKSWRRGKPIFQS